MVLEVFVRVLERELGVEIHQSNRFLNPPFFESGPATASEAISAQVIKEM
jgi:hypothetical protein